MTLERQKRLGRRIDRPNSRPRDRKPGRILRFRQQARSKRPVSGAAAEVRRLWRRSRPQCLLVYRDIGEYRVGPSRLSRIARRGRELPLLRGGTGRLFRANDCGGGQQRGPRRRHPPLRRSATALVCRDCMVADAVLKNQSAEAEFCRECFFGGPKRGLLALS